MTLKKTALLALRGLSKEDKKAIAKKMGVEVSTIYRWILENHENMTRAGNLKIISEAIGIPEDEMFETEEPVSK